MNLCEAECLILMTDWLRLRESAVAALNHHYVYALKLSEYDRIARHWCWLSTLLPRRVFEG